MPAGLYRALLTIAGAIAAIVLAIVISSVAIIAAGAAPRPRSPPSSTSARPSGRWSTAS